jgi:hypothetical protein
MRTTSAAPYNIPFFRVPSSTIQTNCLHSYHLKAKLQVLDYHLSQTKKMFKLIENLVNKDKVVTLYHNNISGTKERTYLLSLVSFSKNLNSWYTTKFGCSSAIFCHLLPSNVLSLCN